MTTSSSQPSSGAARKRLWEPLSYPQASFLAAPEFEVGYGGAKGGAKTESLVILPLMFTGHPRFKALLLRETFPELQEIRDRCARYYKPLGAEWRAGEERWVFPSGAMVQIGYCERLEHVERYHGTEPTLIAFDEIGNLAEERVLDRLVAEIRTSSPDLHPMLRWGANPGGKGHAWVKRRMIVPTDRGKAVYTDPATGLTRRFIQSRVRDNPVYANDERYMAQLRALPDLLRRQLLDGDWDAGEGMALEELSRAVHLIPPKAVPAWWYQWGALDIGFSHCWCFVWGAMDNEGRAYVVDSWHGHHERYDQIAERLRDEVRNQDVLSRTVTDNFARAETNKAQRDRTPSVAELFSEYGIFLGVANQKRVLGLNNLRLWLGWRLADGKTKTPRLRFFDTPGNRVTFDCLERMVLDPLHPEDVLKVHANEMGQGGDDPYDTIRYLMADHPYTPTEPSRPESLRERALKDPMIMVGEITAEDRQPQEPEYETIGGLSHGF